jgi:hypothetical protein
MTNKVSFIMYLYDDESTHEKLTIMSPMEIMFDDERNIVPEEYYDLVNLDPGRGIRVTIEKI